MKAGRLNEQIISFKNISWQESTTNAFLIAFALTSLANTYPCVRWNPSYRYLQLWHSRGTGGLRLRQDAAGQRPQALWVLRSPLGCQGQEGWPMDSEILFKMGSSGPQLQKNPKHKRSRALKVPEGWTQWGRTRNTFCYFSVEKKNFYIAQSPNLAIVYMEGNSFSLFCKYKGYILLGWYRQWTRNLIKNKALLHLMSV